MKTIAKLFAKTTLGIALAAFLLLSYSCTQDSVMDAEETLTAVNAKSKKGKKATRAWRAKLSNVGDLNQPLVDCTPDVGFELTTNFISGNMTHLGKIQSGSFGRPQPGTCFVTGPNTARAIFIVNYIGAHGDMITTEEDVTLILDLEADPTGGTGTFVNTKDMDGNIIPIKILEGTGRFEGAEGELFFKDAQFSPDADGVVVSTWRLIGEITY